VQKWICCWRSGVEESGNTGKTPGQHIKDAILHSTDFWYARNEESRMAASFRAKAISGNYFVGPITFSTNRFGEDSALYMHPANHSSVKSINMQTP
jgi:hypothetical protein